MKLILIIISVISLIACSTLPEPRLDSAAAGAAETRLLEQVRQLFSEGRYAQAGQKARQALDLNPASAQARFAVAAAHFGMDEYRESVAASREAARYRSDLLPDIYLLLGAGQERLDAPWDALRTYRNASRQYPDNPLLHYRLALLYMQLEKPELAAERLQSVLRLDPLNPDPHFQLGMLYADHGYRTPALLALSVALALEPRSGPVTLIHETVDALLAPAYAPPPGPRRTDEGDFRATDAALAKPIAFASGRGADDDDPERLRARYRVLFGTLDAAWGNGREQGFAARFYVPLYREIGRQGLADAFINRVCEGRPHAVFRQWTADHRAELARLQALVRNHHWPGNANPGP